MSSKVYKGGATAGAHEFAWKGDHSTKGVSAFELGRAGESETPPQSAPPPEPVVDVEAVRKQAFQEGLQAGKSAAEKRLAEESSQRAAELSKLFDELASYKSKLRNEAEAELVELAFSIAKKIVRRELSVDAGAVTALVKSCMQEFPSVGVKKVRVHPEDLAMVRGALGPGVRAEADAAIPRGGALLESDQGLLDARIDTQLEEIALGLADA